MKRAIVLALAIAVGALTAQPVLSQDTPVPTRVGYVDVRRVFDEYWKRESIEKNLRARTDALETRIKTEKARIDQLSEALATLNEESDDYRAKRRDIDVAKFQLKMDQEDEMRRLQRDARREEALLYKDVVRECEAFGSANGYAALEMYAPLTQTFEKEADLDIVVATRAVLWRDERADVTNQILANLNAGRPR